MEKDKKILIPIFLTTILQWMGAVNSYQIPLLFEPQIIQKFQVSTLEYSYLYTAVTFPNMITSLISVYIIQKSELGFPVQFLTQ